MDVDADNERHRREEQERRAKRKAHREAKAKSESQTEKERKRREHAQRILQAQKKQKPPAPSTGTPATVEGGSSQFQALFHQRAEGFLIDLRFRNAPPRPPVGPCFVGLGLEGELTDKWTKYKARNAVEKQYVWKLHSEADLGVPLAVSALDYEGCYTDPEKAAASESKGKKDGEDVGTPGEGGKRHVVPTLHPDDDALINWKGGLGDTAAEQLQQKRDRARAAARLAIAQGYGSPNPKALSATGATPTASGSSAFRLKKKSHLQSRILDEKIPQFMKKTTYLTNDATSVHRFTSLAHTQEQRAKDVDRALEETKTKYTETDIIERGFQEANSWDVVRVGDEASAKNAKKKRSHPTKPNVRPVWDLPLLPDIPTWGQTYTHVVLDNPPKSVNALKTPGAKDVKKEKENLVTGKQLHKAIVADVTKQTQNARMACTVWVPDQGVVSDSDASKEPPTKKVKGASYQAVQRYDLDVYPLRDNSAPAVHYVWMIDPASNYVGYHMVGSRVQLSTGRPISLSKNPDAPASGSEIPTDKSIVTRRAMEGDEKKEAEMKMAEVDVDMAEKLGLMKDDDYHGGGATGGGNSEAMAESGKKARRGSSDSEDDQMDDAF